MISARRGPVGVTLVELILALTVMAVALFGLFGMVLRTRTVTEAQRDLTRAKQAAITKVEELRAQEWAALTDPGTSLFDPFPVDGLELPLGTSGQNRQEVGVIYTRSEGTDPSTGEVVMLDFEIEIMWQSPKGNTTYTLRSMITR